MALLERYETILQALLREARRHYGPRLVACAVFGSVARGTPREGSDIDVLLVVTELPPGRMKRIEEFRPVEESLEPLLAGVPGAAGAVSVSAILKTPQEVTAGTPLLLDMVEDALILQDEGGFLANRLEHLRGRLRELGAQRIFRGNAWHWVLKPDLKPGEVFEL